MLTSTSNTELSKDQAAHSRSRLLFNMAVPSLYYLWPYNYIVAHHSSCTSKHRRFQTACNWRCSLTWDSLRLQLIISVVFTMPALLQPICNRQVPGCTVAVSTVTLLVCSCKLLHCGVPGCSDCSCCSVTWNACMWMLVERPAFMLLAIPTRHQHICALVVWEINASVSHWCVLFMCAYKITFAILLVCHTGYRERWSVCVFIKKVIGYNWADHITDMILSTY